MNDEKILLKRCQSGERDAFEELLTLYNQKVYNIAYRMMGNYHDTSDVVQEVFVRIFKSLRNFRGDCAFSTWIYHITINVCKDELRVKKKYNDDSIDEYIFTEKGGVAKEFADDSPGPEECYEIQELSEQLQSVIDLLHPDYRAVIILREQKELSYQEISDILGVSLGTVKSRINRARAALAKKIIDNPKLFPNSYVYMSRTEDKKDKKDIKPADSGSNKTSFVPPDEKSSADFFAGRRNM